jgi:hypothetical protein
MKHFSKNLVFLFFFGAIFEGSLAYGDQICTNLLDEEGSVIAQFCQDSKSPSPVNEFLEKNEMMLKE